MSTAIRSVLETFKVGAGPSSSHSIGPQRASKAFLARLPERPSAIRVTLFGSLAETGKGHLTDQTIQQALLPVPEDFPDAEERRLLYVAITRARKRVWLLFDKENPSRFVEALRQLNVPVARKP